MGSMYPNKEDKDELVGMITGLVEQRALALSQGKKDSLRVLEEEASNSVGLQGCSEVMQGDNWKSQNR